MERDEREREPLAPRCENTSRGCSNQRGENSRLRSYRISESYEKTIRWLLIEADTEDQWKIIENWKIFKNKQ